MEDKMTTYEKIYEAVKQIPKGRVATYGQVAALAGNRGWARAVGNALHKNPDPASIPCYRVVNSRGEVSKAFAFGGGNRQRDLLRADGVEFDENGRVIMKKYGI
ncbi:MAG: MGMT family protein [Candidatus Ornithomonoglobus sp.]